jgi:NADH/NAD ratio-sensing transcriptional regulator Rex
MRGVRSRRPVTSRELAEELGLSEETVRHDLKNVRIEGRPGAGYDIEQLFAALEECLDLSAAHPFIAVGTADMLRGLSVTFPASHFGLQVVGYLSEQEADRDALVDGIPVRVLDQASELVEASGATLALVASAPEPESIDAVLRSLKDAGIRGALLLTPVLGPIEIDGLEITYFRLPCALKALARSATVSARPCCGVSRD